jgi:hypothetical protein
MHEIAESVRQLTLELVKKPSKTHPSRLHSPISFCLQQLSLKSLTGLNSHNNGRMAYHLSFRFSSAFADSVS